MSHHITTRPLKEISVAAPKKTENEATEQMDMSAAGEDMEVCFLVNDVKTYFESFSISGCGSTWCDQH